MITTSVTCGERKERDFECFQRFIFKWFKWFKWPKWFQSVLHFRNCWRSPSGRPPWYREVDRRRRPWTGWSLSSGERHSLDCIPSDRSVWGWKWRSEMEMRNRDEKWLEMAMTRCQSVDTNEDSLVYNHVNACKWIESIHFVFSRSKTTSLHFVRPAGAEICWAHCVPTPDLWTRRSRILEIGRSPNWSWRPRRRLRQSFQSINLVFLCVARSVCMWRWRERRKKINNSSHISWVESAYLGFSRLRRDVQQISLFGKNLLSKDRKRSELSKKEYPAL